MKRKVKFLPAVALSLLLGFAVSACGGKGETPTSSSGGVNPPSNSSAPAQSSSQTPSKSSQLEKISVTATDDKKTLILGETVQLISSVDGVTWSSKDATIASVDGKGLVTSVGKGSTTITAKKEGYRDGTISIKVELEKITVTAADNKTKLLVNETVLLTASKEGVTWTSSDDSVASVDAGLVTAHKLGSATITAAREGFDSGSISIEVTRPDPTAVLHFEDADHYTADGTWSSTINGQSYGPGAESPVYAKDSASDGTCIAYFGNGDKETLTFTSDKAVKAELVITMLSRSSYDDLTTLVTIKFNGNDVTFTGSYTGGDDYPIGELSLGELDLVNGNNVLELNFLAATPYLDDLRIYAAETATIAVVPVQEKDPVVLKQESLTLVKDATAQIESDMTELRYTSANADIASVDDTGLVTGVGVGSTTIAVSKDGYKTVRLPVTVTEKEGVIIAQVESGTSEDSVVTFKTSNNLESGNLMVNEWPTDAVLTINFVAKTAGKYLLSMNARAHGGYQSSETDDIATCLEIKVNNAAISASGTVAGGPFALYELAEVDLVEGQNTMTIKNLNTAPTIDLFRFDPVEA